ncbi:MAG: BtrH N-terminal domain-containing protein [Bacillota bacterium]
MRYIIENFVPLSGKHCITTSMRQIFKHAGHDISEEMLFGLGSGLGFYYGEFKDAPYPIIGHRAKIGEFEQRIAESLGINIGINKTSSIKKAYDAMLELLKQDKPVMVYTDMPYLRYLKLPEDAHFGGHSIVVFGVDEEQGTAYVSDRDGKDFAVTLNKETIPEDFHIIDLEDLKNARASKCRVYPPENKWVTFDFEGIKDIDAGTVFAAVRDNARNILDTPIKNAGIRGIKHFSDRLTGWSDFEDEKLRWAAFNVFIMTSHIGGSGGGAFRKMYGSYLRECGSKLNIKQLTDFGDEYYEAGELWDKTAYMFRDIHESLNRDLLKDISKIIYDIYEKELDIMSRLSYVSI